MAIVLAATGLFVHGRLHSELDDSIDQGLRSRADAVAALVQQADTGLREAGRSSLARRDVAFAQIVDARGRIVDATPDLHSRSLLDASERVRAQRATVMLDRADSPVAGPVRLLATPVNAQDQRLVVVVGSSLRDRDRALAGLGTLLLVGGPVALLLAAAAGYGVAAAALRPVEAMRRRAGEMSDSMRGERLPVTPAADEISRLGATLNELLGRLEAAVDRERRFVANAGHELMTPLAVLQTELELAADRPPEELPAIVRSATDETGRLSRLARDLLMLARSGDDALAIRPAPVDVGALLDRIASRFATHSGPDGAGVSSSAPAGLVVHADATRLEQALSNLVDNALRHGGGDVELAARADDGSVELHVTDHGPGFPDAFLERAFDRFTRGGEAGQEGAGLGLAIVTMVADGHGGSAGAANLPGGGADVWVSIPAQARARAGPVS
jgi:signal transduction histidine kinase